MISLIAKQSCSSMTSTSSIAETGLGEHLLGRGPRHRGTDDVDHRLVGERLRGVGGEGLRDDLDRLVLESVLADEPLADDDRGARAVRGG